MITATKHGRGLLLTVEAGEGEAAIEPFYVAPVSAREGRAMSSRYMLATVDLADTAQIGVDMVNAFGRENAERAQDECTIEECDLLLNAAWHFNTIGGWDALTALLSVDSDGTQGGVEARGKALTAFRLRAVPLLSQISHDMESARRTLEGATPDTVTRPGGAQPDEPSSSEPSESQLQPEVSTSQTSTVQPSPPAND